jgi:hypothetical protein
MGTKLTGIQLTGTTTKFLAPPLSALMLMAAVLFSPVATAAPKCTNVSPQTTRCDTLGSTSIYTSPPPMDFGWPGWTYGYGWGGPGLVIGFG